MSSLPKSLPLGYSLLLAGLLCIANTAVGHYLAPFGILLTPVVIGLLVSLLLPLKATYSSTLLRVFLLALLICAHDIGIKLYAGGTHDIEGQGFIHALLFMGLLPAYGYILYSAIRQQGLPLLTRVSVSLLFPLVISLHLFFFANVGYEFANERFAGC